MFDQFTDYSLGRGGFRALPVCLPQDYGLTVLLSHLSWDASNKMLYGNSLAVQWLGLRAFIAEGPVSIPGQGTKIPQAVRPEKKKRCFTNIFTQHSSFCFSWNVGSNKLIFHVTRNSTHIKRLTHDRLRWREKNRNIKDLSYITEGKFNGCMRKSISIKYKWHF